MQRESRVVLCAEVLQELPGGRWRLVLSRGSRENVTVRMYGGESRAITPGELQDLLASLSLAVSEEIVAAVGEQQEFSMP